MNAEKNLSQQYQESAGLATGKTEPANLKLSPRQLIFLAAAYSYATSYAAGYSPKLKTEVKAAVELWDELDEYIIQEDREDLLRGELLQ